VVAIRVSISSSFSFNHTNKLLFECHSLIRVSVTMHSVADKIRTPVTGENGYLGERFVVENTGVLGCDVVVLG
jgi:hypothetical protein